MAQTTNTVVFDVKLNSQQFDSSLKGMKQELKALQGTLGNSILSPKDQQDILNRMGFLKAEIDDLNYSIKNTVKEDAFQNLALAISPVNTALLAASSAARVFTDDTEKIAKIQEKVNAFMSAGMLLQELKDTNRLKGVYLNIVASTKEFLVEKLGLAQKKLMVVAENTHTTAKIRSSVATKAATAAQWLWNAALTANPIGVVITAIAGLVTGLVLLTSWLNRSTKAQIEYNDAQKEMIDNSEDAEKRYQEAIEQHKLLTGELTEEQLKLQKLNDERKETIKLIGLEQQNLNNALETQGAGSKKVKEHADNLKDLKTQLNAVNLEIDNYNLGLKKNTNESIINDRVKKGLTQGFGNTKLTKKEYDSYYQEWLKIKTYIQDIREKEFIGLPISVAEQQLVNELKQKLPKLQEMTIKELFSYQANLFSKFINATIVDDTGGSLTETKSLYQELNEEFEKNSKILLEQQRNGEILTEHLVNRNKEIKKELELLDNEKKYLEDVYNWRIKGSQIPEWAFTQVEDINVDGLIADVEQAIDEFIRLGEEAEEVDKILNPKKYEEMYKRAATSWQERVLGIKPDEWEEMKKELKNLGFETIGSLINDRIQQSYQDNLDALSQAMDDYYDEESEKLQEQRDNDVITEEQYTLKKKKLDEKYKEEQRKYRIEEFKREKEAALWEIAIQTAVGIAKAIPNAALMIMAGAVGASQAAIVAGKPIPKYAKGGILGSGLFVAGEEGPEAIINNRSTELFKPLLSAINVAGGGVPLTNGNSGMVVMTNEQWNGFLATLNNRPVKAYVTEKDITTTQRRVNRIKQTARL